jgi:hypothetical protein
MGDISIYNSIRSAKVTTGNAWQYQGMRSFDDTAQVCPARANVSDFGVVGVARDSIQTYAPGCFSALDRMQVENVQRPRYSTYLNASAINSPGIGDDDMSQEDGQYGGSKPNYDTQLGYQYVRPVLPRDQMAPSMPLSQFRAVGPTNAQLNESNNISCIMNRTYENRNCVANQ